jgi:hypothetical protein
MNSDFKELLQEFSNAGVEYLIVGGYAVMHYSQPRYTKDLDLWLNPTAENARRVSNSFRAFGIPLQEITEADLAVSGTQYVIGREPMQIDFLTSLPGLEFMPCWERRVTALLGQIPVHYLSKADLQLAKATAGRKRDWADLEELEKFSRD